MDRFEVCSFGRDCLGNATGYRVVDTQENRRVAGQFVGNIYDEGSHQRAYFRACAMAQSLNHMSEVADL